MVRVVTDSVSDIPPAVAQELGITIVPLYVHFGTEVFRDGVDLTADQFYARLASSRSFPATAAPPASEFARVYDRLARESDEIVSIHLSSRLSATWEAALAGRDEMRLDCRVEVIDSRTGIMAEGLLAIMAARMARAGEPLESIAGAVQAAIPCTHTYGCFDSLESMRRGGRVGKAAALLGSILHVSPIIGIQDGEVVPVGRARSRSRAIDRLYASVLQFEGRIEGLSVEYATNPGDAEALAGKLDPVFARERTYISQVSPTVGAHAGPSVLTVSFLTSR